MDFQSAHEMVTGNQQQPMRRSGWPEGHHVRHEVEDSLSKLKLNTPGQEPQDWVPDSNDMTADDWERFEDVPEQQEPAKASEGKSKKSR